VGTQCEFDAPAECEAVDRGSPRLCRWSRWPETPAKTAALVEQHLVGRGPSPFGLEQFVYLRFMPSSIDRFGGPAAECLPCPSDATPLDPCRRRSASRSLQSFDHRGFVEHIHRTAGKMSHVTSAMPSASVSTLKILVNHSVVLPSVACQSPYGAPDLSLVGNDLRPGHGPRSISE